MCGLAGIYDFQRRGSPNKRVLDAKRMADALFHRGPDSSGTWHDDDAGIALSHRRLAIMDLSSAGAQPMHSTDRRWVVVFNGEVYNFQALRAELIDLGATFSGRSDTEVVVEAIAKWGVQVAVARFNGMFAIAVWDTCARSLHLVRDCSGVKPLFWGWLGQRLVFASELKALAALPDWKPEVNTQARATYARFGYIPAPQTIYAGIEKLPIGSGLSIDNEGGAANWTYKAAFEADAQYVPGTEAAGVEQLDMLLRRAVKRRSISDVPVGAFLSGGIDSAAVVAAFQAISNTQIETFTVGFDDASMDESAAAAGVADHLGTAHHTIHMTDQDAATIIPSLSTWYDEPFADSSQISTAMVSKFARRRVTVALSGDGGDELFAGYARHGWADDVWRRISRVPGPVQRAIGSGIGGIGPRGQAIMMAAIPPRMRPASGAAGLAWFGKLLFAPTDIERYLQLVSIGADPFFTSNMTQSTLVALYAGGAFEDSMQSLQEMDKAIYLPDDILVKLDRATMAFGLEGREPMLDTDLIQFARGIPRHLQRQDGRGKHLLRQVLARYLPASDIVRPKRGFSVPLGDWLRGALKPWAEDRLLSKDFADNVAYNGGRILQAWQRMIGGDDTEVPALWSVIMYEDWRRTWMVK